MRKQLLVAILVVGVLALAGAVPASAQSNVSKVDVPFQFIVGDTVLPAGSYVVSNVAYDIVAIQSTNGKAIATALVQVSAPESQKTNAVFSFKKFGGRYFLAEVNIPGASLRTVALPKQRIEAMLAKLNGAKANAGPAL